LHKYYLTAKHRTTDQLSSGNHWLCSLHTTGNEISSVFAGLFTVIIIGLVVENMIFRTIEARTVRRWGMQQ
jgi:NitT/TauT family transport system permease protein